jgi:hypothetical protein
MTMKRTLFALLATALAVGPAGATVSRGHGPFTIGWELTAKRAIEGRVYNESQYPVTRVRVLVEGLDASDRVVAAKLGDVFGDIGPLSDRYFEVRGVPAAHHYRVRVESYTLVDDGPQ